MQLLKNIRSYQKIANLILDKISINDYKIGDHLPSEREMAKLFNVSRTTVREAVIALEVSGILEVKIGSGIYIINNTVKRDISTTDLSWQIDTELETLLPKQTEVAPFDLLKARLLIEPESAALAAKNITDDQLKEIKSAYVMNVQDNINSSTNHLGDRLFHIKIAIASGNEAYEAIIRQFLSHRYGKLFSTLQKNYTSRDMTMRSQIEHLNILVALEKKDSLQAYNAMKLHLTNVIEIFNRQSTD